MPEETQSEGVAGLNKGRDFNHDLRKVLNDVAGGHDLDRNHAKQMLDALKSGSASASGTY